MTVAAQAEAAAPPPSAVEEADLFTRLKLLQRQLEFLDVQEARSPRPSPPARPPRVSPASPR